MVVAGVMSGTSADGVDVAVCRIREGRDGEPRVKVLGHAGFRYPRAVREAVLRAMAGEAVVAAEFSRLSWRLGGLYADCVEKACAGLGVRPRLVGCHGQTVSHHAVAERYLGAEVRSTWQMGEAACVAERLRVPVVSDFRPADLAAGGQGAPLVPMLDWVMFRSGRVGRVLQNLGGIGNLTALPKGCGVEGLVAFDTGPGNMVIDHCMRSLYGREFDRGGAVARRGRVVPGVVERAMEGAYISALPPKSCGREEFGAAFGSRFVTMCREAGAGDADVVATATALTAASVVEAYRRFVRPVMGVGVVEYAVAGGGAKNGTLLRMLREGLEPCGVRVRAMEELGVAVEAKEAVAFALLAWLTWRGRVGNVVAATGAARGVRLGKVSFGGAGAWS